LVNALAETINGLYKAERIHRRAPWKTREALELATLQWTAWFNHQRLRSAIGSSRLPRPRQTTTINATALNNRLFYSREIALRENRGDSHSRPPETADARDAVGYAELP